MVQVILADRALQRYSDIFRESSSCIDWVECDPRDAQRLEKLLPTAEVFVGSQLAKEQVIAARALRFVHVAGAGTEGVALEALRPDVVVANVFGHETSIAEHVLMVMLALSRDLLPADDDLRAGRWRSAAQDTTVPLMGTLSGARMGIIGYGHIGKAVARLGLALDMKVRAVRQRPSQGVPDGLESVGGPDQLDELLRVSDFVVVTVPLAEPTRGMIGAAELALMPKSAFLINVARGPIVDEAALYEALVQEQIAGAALDVWYEPPARAGTVGLPSRLPFGLLPNVIMTPHYSGMTDDTFRSRAIFIRDNIARFVEGEPLENRVR